MASGGRPPDDPATAAHRRHGRQILAAAIAAADPGDCLRRTLSLSRDALQVETECIPLSATSRIVVVGAGKATPAMAQAAEEILGARITGGAISTKYGHRRPLQRIHTTECGHPIPDEAGVEGARRLLATLGGLTSDDVVLCLLSGGGSALLPAPAAGLSLADKQQTTEQLLACGASIDEVNTIRKHLSALKGGQLARHAHPARLVTLAVSDVIGDGPATIASGPTVADPTTFADCLALLDRYDLGRRIPATVHRYLEAGARGAHPETPGTGAPELQRSTFHVIGNNSLALTAAGRAAAACGYQPLVLSSRIAGETRDVARVHAAIGVEIASTSQPLPPPACLISGGETTVTLSPAAGKGGRNQEFALAAAVALAGQPGITILSAGTDGTDGPTDAAGAVADGRTVARGADLGYSATRHLDRHDAYPFFAALGDLVVTGATGTNVMDLRLVLVS